eukprot:34747-Eustigmatos_ZCMA.PRE.1
MTDANASCIHPPQHCTKPWTSSLAMMLARQRTYTETARSYIVDHYCITGSLSFLHLSTYRRPAQVLTPIRRHPL